MAMMGIGGLLAAMSACAASDEPQVFVLRATGADVDEAEVSYTVDGEEETHVVSLPWRLEVEIDGAFDIDLTVTNPTDVSTVGCGIELGPGSPEVMGEVAATCTTAGRTSGDTHRIACTTTYDPGDVAPSSFTVYAPADWLAPTDSTSGVVCEAAPGGDGVQAFSRRVSGITMDEMIEGALGNAGYAVGDVGVTQTTVGSLPAVRTSFPDETILWVVVMTEEVGTVLVIDAGDVALNDAMAASVAVAE